ncbi:ATP-dependent DNA ligase [Antiquaquibacter soli]|uniref:ATP-dependent DNA ligase n=1 Tax=Antiquaquibacter soli TaxID=3064523 RepID=A0ABT9BVX1_9MICO|nr:ATP-dependent DNA ligase [Protaetiibacter sp. WY-16]MDO7883452.1 ATP-dependent DNA ligase [Protaetiibacter sp. WY-16]
MGTLTYDNTIVRFDDRVLTHLQIAIVRLFRRELSFPMSWKRAVEAGSGRGSLWMVHTTPVYFDFEGSRIPTISDEWVARLEDSAMSSTGLIVSGEHGELVGVGASTPVPAYAFAR